MSEFVINASCSAKDGSTPEYENKFEITGRKEIMKRFGMTDTQFDQEASDNIARRITNGVRQYLRDKGKDAVNADLDKYVEEWMPGRRASASPLNAVKKLVTAASLTPEMAEQAEAILARAKAELEAQIAAMTATEAGGE